jgi:hypothetical protein
MQGIMSHTDAYASALTHNMTAVFRIAPVLKQIIKDARTVVKEERAATGPSRSEILKQAKELGLTWEGRSGLVPEAGYEDILRQAFEVEKLPYSGGYNLWGGDGHHLGEFKTRNDARFKAAQLLVEEAAGGAKAKPATMKRRPMAPAAKPLTWDEVDPEDMVSVYGYDGDVSVVRVWRYGPSDFEVEVRAHGAFEPLKGSRPGSLDQAKRQGAAAYAALVQPAPPGWEYNAREGRWSLEKDGNVVGEVVKGASGVFFGYVLGRMIDPPGSSKGDDVVFTTFEEASAEVERQLANATRGKSHVQWEPLDDRSGVVMYGEFYGNPVVSVQVWAPGLRYEPRLWDAANKRWNKGVVQRSFEAAKLEAERVFDLMQKQEMRTR